MSVTGTAVAASSLKLEAINKMLRCIGEAPVSALDTGTVSIAGIAEQVLDEVRSNILGQGWFENTDTEVTITPDGSDHLIVPDDALRIDTSGSDAGLNLSVLNGRLYDRDEQTDEFDASVEVMVIRLLSFDNCSPPMREYITALAKVEFQRDHQGDTRKDAMLRDDAALAKQRMWQFECDNGGHSVLNTVHAHRVLGTDIMTPSQR